MEVNKMYQLLIEGHYAEVIDRLEGDISEKKSGEECILALAYALDRRANDSRILLDQVSRETCDEQTKAICFEVEMIVEGLIGDDKERIKSLAEQALKYNKSSIFALRILGKIAELRKDFEEALRYYNSALDIHPESNRTSLDIARNLIFLKKRAEAVRIIKTVPRSLWRIAYHLTALVRGPLRIFVIIVIAALVINPVTAVYSFWGISALCAVIMVYSWLVSDSLIFSTSFYFLISTLAIGLLSFVMSISIYG